MTTEATRPDIGVSRRQNWWRGLFTQENITTTVVSLIVGVPVILPIIALIVSSFLVLDDLGFDTEWGLQNYRDIFEGRVIRKALVNTALISTGGARRG